MDPIKSKESQGQHGFEETTEQMRGKLNGKEYAEVESVNVKDQNFFKRIINKIGKAFNRILIALHLKSDKPKPPNLSDRRITSKPEGDEEKNRLRDAARRAGNGVFGSDELEAEEQGQHVDAPAEMKLPEEKPAVEEPAKPKFEEQAESEVGERTLALEAEQQEQPVDAPAEKEQLEEKPAVEEQAEPKVEERTPAPAAPEAEEKEQPPESQVESKESKGKEKEAESQPAEGKGQQPKDLLRQIRDGKELKHVENEDQDGMPEPKKPSNQLTNELSEAEVLRRAQNNVENSTDTQEGGELRDEAEWNEETPGQISDKEAEEIRARYSQVTDLTKSMTKAVGGEVKRVTNDLRPVVSKTRNYAKQVLHLSSQPQLPDEVKGMLEIRRDAFSSDEESDVDDYDDDTFNTEL